MKRSATRFVVLSILGYLTALLGAGVAESAPVFRFAPKATTGLAPYVVELADMDGDGKLDLITANIADQETGTISVAKGNGNGTFGTPVDYPVGPVPSAMRVVDFNGDGRPDVLCIAAQSGNNANDLNSYVTVLRNNGTGGLGNRMDYSVGQNAHSNAVEVGDFDGDGWLDFAVASQQTYVHVYRNLGNGTFALLTQVTPPFTASHIAVADFNGDGRVDLIVGSVDGTEIFFNNGAGIHRRDLFQQLPGWVRAWLPGISMAMEKWTSPLLAAPFPSTAIWESARALPKPPTQPVRTRSASKRPIWTGTERRTSRSPIIWPTRFPFIPTTEPASLPIGATGVWGQVPGATAWAM